MSEAKAKRLPRVIRMMRRANLWFKKTAMNGGPSASSKPNPKRHSKPPKYGPGGRVERRIKVFHGGNVPAELADRVKG